MTEINNANTPQINVPEVLPPTPPQVNVELHLGPPVLNTASLRTENSFPRLDEPFLRVLARWLPGPGTFSGYIAAGGVMRRQSEDNRGDAPVRYEVTGTVEAGARYCLSPIKDFDLCYYLGPTAEVGVNRKEGEDATFAYRLGVSGMVEAMLGGGNFGVGLGANTGHYDGPEPGMDGSYNGASLVLTVPLEL